VSKQITLLRVTGIALGAGLIAFFAFYAIFGIWFLAIIVGLATGIFFAIVGGLVLISVADREKYRREMERRQRRRAKKQRRKSRFFQPTSSQRYEPEPNPPNIVESELAKIIQAEDEEPEIPAHPQQSKARAKAKKQPAKPRKSREKEKKRKSLQFLFFPPQEKRKSVERN
jgi:heme exporter protein D